MFRCVSIKGERARKKEGKSIPGAQYDIWVLTQLRISNRNVCHVCRIASMYASMVCEHNQPYSIFPLHSSIRCGFEFDTNQSGNEKNKLERTWKSNQSQRAKEGKKREKGREKMKFDLLKLCGWIACHAFTKHRTTSEIIEGIHAHMHQMKLKIMNSHLICLHIYHERARGLIFLFTHSLPALS